MRVRCIAELPSEKQAQQLGDYYHPGKQVFNVRIGEEYIVYGISFLGGVPWIELREEFGYLWSAPLCLFEITDGQVSRYWEIRYDGAKIMFWPPSFYQDFYFDDLIEGVPGVLEDFRQVSTLIESEVKSN